MYKNRRPSPLGLKNPEFECNAPYDFPLESNVQISDPNSGYKADRFSTLTFRTDNTGGYPMRIALRLDGVDSQEWITQGEVLEISIQFAGDYEADVLKRFFQHVGLMMTPVYGPLNTDEE